MLPGLFHKINLRRLQNLLNKHKLFKIDVIHAHVNYPAAHLAIGLKQIFPKAKYLVQHHGLDVYQRKNGRIKFLLINYKINFSKSGQIYYYHNLI